MTRRALGLAAARAAGRAVLVPPAARSAPTTRWRRRPRARSPRPPASPLAPAPGHGPGRPRRRLPGRRRSGPQGSVLHVGRQQVDLSPIEIEAFVVVPGGVFLLSQGELWFTDLARVRGTGQTDVTGVAHQRRRRRCSRSWTRGPAGRRRRATTPRPAGRSVRTGRHPDVPSRARTRPARRAARGAFACRSRCDRSAAWLGDSTAAAAPACCVGETERRPRCRRRPPRLPRRRLAAAAATRRWSSSTREVARPVGAGASRGITACPG